MDRVGVATESVQSQCLQICNGATAVLVVEGDGTTLFLFIHSSICHINTLHNCHGSLFSPSLQILSCASGLQLASEGSKKMSLSS